MNKNLRLLLCLCLLFMGIAGASPVSVTVTPKVTLKRNATIRMVVRVEPHADNTYVRLIIDGPKYNAQDLEVGGIDGPRIFERFFNSIPPGQYEARAELNRKFDKVLYATDKFCVAGPDVDCQPPDR